MRERLAARALSERLVARFAAAGAERVDPPILQDAGSLLELYGEEIRARAYLTADPLRGERILRPDFTVPVVQAHLARGAPRPARYAYAGEVFRRQEDDPRRPSEYLQVGFEMMGESDPVAAEAEGFAMVESAVSGLGLRPAIGDISILRAAVAGLPTSERRRAALMRHIWRPRRFRWLLERFAGQHAPPPSRARLVSGETVLPTDIRGKRSRAEIAARVEWLKADAALPPVGEAVLGMFDELLSLRESAPNALGRLEDLAVDMPAIMPSLERMMRRLELLDKHGVDPHSLEFEASYGRTSMEYYDGFVFGFYAPSRPDLPPIASGGRYDLLAEALGADRSMTAFGAVIRPELMQALSGETDA